MNKENLFLKIIGETLSKSSHIGDDCAYLKEFNLLVSEDTLNEGVHFLLDYYTPYEIGKKAILVNLSDIYAGGGIPKYLTVSVSGKLNENFIKEFYRGVNEICNKYNVEVIGGDLTGGSQISVSVAILGDTKNRKISSRKNAKKGYLVYLKGYHGSSKTGLDLLLKGNTDKNNEFIKSHIEPSLYPEISNIVSTKTNFPYAMMDTSDGLYDALYKISRASNVGFKINFDKIPKKTEDRNSILFGGEDFGLLICIDSNDKGIFEETSDFKLIGEVTDSNKIIIDNMEILKDESYKHFI